MAKGNRLEKAILKGGIKAQQEFGEISKGEWLDKAPEYFVTVAAAIEIGRAGYTVFLDSSHKRNRETLPSPLKGVHKNDNQRPDITVWQKERNKRAYAAIEVKIKGNSTGVKWDVKKLRKQFLRKDAPRSAYLLLYASSNKSSEQGLREKFQRWSEKMKCERIDSHVAPDVDFDSSWVWGVTVYKVRA